ncbi:cell division inhibitor SepF [Modestobacter sp. DSM 44400]|uniref:cell division protein SepF n=1 Tax=Modestobacter sp. DSM 44400 TaxID=1550230 RepID=UPI00089A9B16|nr:cell division protein SepF [Modestobacter sp. DSM 44400]SDX95815.1 cell division inhibitor SepF [Modestobacter sp. DSM 44400]
MAGAMRKMGVYLGLVEDDDARGGYDRYPARQTDYDDRGYDRYSPAGEYDDADGDYPADGYAPAGYDEPVEPLPEPEPAPLIRRPVAARSLGLAASPAAAPSAGTGSTRLGGGSAAAAGLAVREPVAVTPAPTPAPLTPKPYRITTLHPRTYNEARTIGERFREGLPVIMNLTEMDDADAKRLVDFAAGLSFGLHGSIERVTAKVFLLSPQDVDVTAEDKARIREGGFFNQS